MDAAVKPGMDRAAASGTLTLPTPGVVAGPASPVDAPVAGQRELFLDALRAIALVRVMLWHMFGLPAITYVAAIPAMFFVTGSLLAKSLGRRPARSVLTDRFRRLLVPLWAFGAVAWLVMAIAARRTGADLPLHRVVSWIIPLTDPHGSTWEGGWLSSHLWYLRTLTWLLLASPLLLRAVRAFRGVAVLAAVTAVFVLDALARQGGGLALGGGALWPAGDLALYAIFLMLGFLHRDGAFRAVSRRGWMVVAFLAAGAAVAWRLTQPIPLGVVNNSHPLHLFVGAAWLALALAGSGALGRLAGSRIAGGAIRAISRRSLTIYLWHTGAIIVAVNLLESAGIEGSAAHAVGLVLLTGVGTLIAVQLFGWIEDVAARRAPPARPRSMSTRLSRPALVLSTVAVLAGAALVFPVGHVGAVDSATAPLRPPVPSQAPAAPTFSPEPVAPAGAPGPDASSVTTEAMPKLDARLDELLAPWARAARAGGAVVGVTGAGLDWSGAIGSRPDTGRPVAVKDTIELASLTKLYTANLVHRFAATGLIDLTGPLPRLRSLPDFPYEDGITVDQLLEHRSGLLSYGGTDLYRRNPDAIDGPVSGMTGIRRKPATETSRRVGRPSLSGATHGVIGGSTGPSPASSSKWVLTAEVGGERSRT